MRWKELLPLPIIEILARRSSGGVRNFQSRKILIGGDNPAELRSLEEVERRYILHVLDAVGGNKTEASQILGLDRKTLYRKLTRYEKSEKSDPEE